jgi:MFS family permease
MLAALGPVRSRLTESFRALHGAFRNPAIRRIELAYAGSAIGLYANSVAVSVYAYRHGGATAVGLFLFARLGASSIAAPFSAALADRHRQERVMLAADLIRVATVAGTAVAAAAGASAGVYVLATLTSIVATAFRPAEASLMPALAATPEELTAANVTSSTFDSVGAFAGPTLAAFLLALGGSTAAFAAVAATYAWSAWFVARVHPQRRPEGESAGEEAEGFAAGVRAVRHEPRLQLLIGLYGAQTLVAGAYGVLVVVVALQLLGLGSAGVGLLEAATGVGAIAGALIALALAGRRRTAADLCFGLFLFGAPLLAIGALPHVWAAVIALALLGVGNSIVDISAVTLLQRTVPAAVAGRVFGLLESTIVGALALGSLAVPLLVHVIGVRGALFAAGALLPVLTLLTRRPLGNVDMGATVPDEQLAAVRSVAFLNALPLQRQEALAAALTRVELPSGATLFSRGDAGDRFYVLADGTLAIELPDGVKHEAAPAFVGEIALLRDVPRTATVRAETDALLWALGRTEFLDAVSGHARSRSAAESVVASRGALFGV